VAYSSREYFRTIAQLGIQAAEALEHAHRNGILHRDVKPANLLVDDAGKLWITDFGLARLDTAATLTASGDLLGTLRYMSPEMVRGDHAAVNARSDIYALGVTLYELLTLRPAYDAADRGKLVTQISDVEPRPPSRINPAIAADLETIVLKAMEKDVTSRYDKAQDMADDLRRFLEHKPIRACRASLLERAGKWARRHVALVTSIGAALIVATVSFLIAALLTLRAYNLESQQRTAAVANLRVASDSIDRMLSRVADDQYFHGDLVHAETLAADATEFYEKLLTHSDDPQLRFKAAEAHEIVAGIWYLVGQYEKARVASLRSIELLRPLIATFPADDKYLSTRGAAYLRLGQAEWGFDGSAAAEQPFAQAVADFEILINRFPHEPKYRGSYANALNNLGMVRRARFRADEAERFFERALEIMKHLPEAIRNTPEARTIRAGTLSNWAMAVRERGDTKRAMQLLGEAISLHKQSLDEWPTNPVAVNSLFIYYCHLGEVELQAGQHQAAAKTVETLVWAVPNQLRSYHYGAEQLLRCAALAEGETAAVTRTSDADFAKPAEMPAASDRAASAEDYRRRARELVARAADAPIRTPDTTERFAWFLVTCADESLRDPRRALELATSVVQEVPRRGDAWLTLALAHYRLGDWQAADDAMQKATKLPHYVAEMRVCDWLLLAMIRQQQGRSDEARQLYKKARDRLTDVHTDEEDVLRLAAEADALIAN
jgi:tetratricopeptide (TPR) repeat protein